MHWLESLAEHLLRMKKEQIDFESEDFLGCLF